MTLRDDPDDEAARWIALRQSGEMTAKRWEEYSSWLMASERNRSAIAAYEKLLEQIDQGSDVLLADEFEQQLVEASAAAEDEETLGQSRRSTPWRAIAATLAIAIAGLISDYVARPYFHEPVRYASEVGERLSVALDDGSTATLNTASTLAVKFSNGKRGVSLTQGEALFEVARDASRPFIVATPVAKIRVTGTVFNVRSLPGETVVQVVSGIVNVTSKDGNSLPLTAGQSVRVSRDSISVVSNFDPADTLAWREGKARYRDTPLGAVVADLNRYFSVPMALSESSLAELPVTGEFDLADQKTIVAAITEAFDLKSDAGDARIVFAPSDPH